MANNPGFASIPNTSAGIAVTADASRTAPNAANTPTIFTAGPNGSRVERIHGIAVGNTTQTILRLWLYNPTGPQWFLQEEIVVVPVTVSATQTPAEFTREAVTTPEKMPLLLKPNWQLRVSINDTQAGGGVCVTATGGDF